MLFRRWRRRKPPDDAELDERSREENETSSGSRQAKTLRPLLAGDTERRLGEVIASAP